MEKIKYHEVLYQRVSGDPKNSWKLIKDFTNKPYPDEQKKQ